MKMIYCSCNISVLEQVVEIIDSFQIKDYQIFDQVLSRNRLADPRLNTAVWPGYNASLILQVREQEKANQLMQKLRDFNRSAANVSEVLTACSWTIDDYIYDQS
ncbi:MAG: hypothetical protein KJ578_10730 [Bacteroidetes bacterium]|nr:hypothetical protein [Bacteroidota bacterium]MBU1577875.1 hypothetical protein [Bacteroidota bacterium]MBU2465298.1 hypothetical protein [Bacteroidota bacterium]MBU2558242.1 hypothetical protein [Bacteroidota bacterium]